MVINLLFVLIANILDVIFGSLFSLDLSKLSITIIFHFTLISLILISRKADKIDSFLIAFIVGGIIGNRLNGFFLEMGCIYLFVLILINRWFQNFNESFIEAIILIILAVFIEEFILYILMLSYQRTTMTALNWIQRRGIPTIFGNVFPCILMLFLNRIQDDFIQKRELTRRKEENLFFKSAEARIKKK